MREVIRLGIILLIPLLFMLSFKSKDKSEISKVSENDNYNYIAVNECFMWVSNNGSGSHDPRTDGSGFYWPGGENAKIPAIFQDGLLFGGKYSDEIRVNGNTHRQGLQAGKILEDGTPDDPSKEKYRVYKIRRDWEKIPPGPKRNAYEKDYLEWPVEDGAPWIDKNNDGIYTVGIDEPEITGDEMLWYVSNDMDPARSTFTYGTLPMGLEFQVKVFGYKRTGDLGDMLFKNYRVMHKGTTTIRDMYISYWSDTDMGDANDDYTGCDTTLSIGYTWNGDNDDAGWYNDKPPALGYKYFQGPIVESSQNDSAKFLGDWRKGYKNLPMTSFIDLLKGMGPFRDPQQGVPDGSIELYNYFQGLDLTGSSIINPITNQITKFMVSGDPVTGTGWYEGEGFPGGPAPGDRRHLISSGPFNFSPGDTQEVVIGIIVGQGEDRFDSITELKRKSKSAQTAYDLDFELEFEISSPKLHSSYASNKISLWWEASSEDYELIDPILSGTDLRDKSYKFQGYRLWQYSDEEGNDPYLIGIWDVVDSIDIVWDYRYIGSQYIKVPVIEGPNEGLRRSFTVEYDYLEDGIIQNGKNYYFGITAYAVSPNSSPTYFESSPQIIEIIPGRGEIDVISDYKIDDIIIAEQKVGYSDGLVQFKIIDPLAITGHEYDVEIEREDEGQVYYSIKDVTINKYLAERESTVVENKTSQFGEIYIPENDTLGQKVFDGFHLTVEDQYRNITYNQPFRYVVKEVLETKGENGEEIEPRNVWNQQNSTGDWMIEGRARFGFIWQDKSSQSFGFNDYEIRFGENEASPWYANGYQRGLIPPVVSDPLGEGTVPFSIWDLKNTPDDPSDDERLAIKISDYVRKLGSNENDSTKAMPDKKWTQLEDGSWEQIYAYRVDDPLNLPNPSPRADQMDLPFGGFTIVGDIPAEGTVIRLVSLKPINDGDVFTAKLNAPVKNDYTTAKNKIGEITVFPNPYYGNHSFEKSYSQRFVRFTGLPEEVIIRIYSLSGVFIKRIDKNTSGEFVDWDLRNQSNQLVGSGIYLAYLEMPGVGEKILKLAVIQENRTVD